MTIQEQNCLVLDTSNRWVLAAVANKEGCISRRLEAPRSAFQILPGIIQELCQRAGIKKPCWIVSTIGPGSFTGVRLGVSFARNLAQLWQVPAMGIISLRFYCYDLLYQKKERSGVAIILDGKQGRVYGASLASQDQASSGLGTRNFELADQPPHIFLETLPADYILFADDPQTIASYVPQGEQWTQVRQKIKNTPKMPIPDPAHLYKLALQSGAREKAAAWSELMPLYLRADPAHALHPRGLTS